MRFKAHMMVQPQQVESLETEFYSSEDVKTNNDMN